MVDRDIFVYYIVETTVGVHTCDLCMASAASPLFGVQGRASHQRRWPVELARAPVARWRWQGGGSGKDVAAAAAVAVSRWRWRW